MFSLRVIAKPAKSLVGVVCASAFIFVSGCGGGGGGGGGGGADSVAGTSATEQSAINQAERNGQVSPITTTITYPKTEQEAARFLTQATFGPTDADVQQAIRMGFGPWIDAQIALPITGTHVAYWDARDTAYKALNPTSGKADSGDFNHSFWQQAMTAPDQLRQRVAFALSQIFVVSAQDGCGADHARGLAGYYDMLAANAFGNYRTLLEKVARHPVMGCYLSHLKSQKENTITGRVPDENFAREIMQLFSIGLYQLNTDGSFKKNGQGNPIDTYTAADVSGIAKVFTGFSYDCPDAPADGCFFYGTKNGRAYSDMWNRSMVGYAPYHSSSAKTFLGVTIPAQGTATPDADLKTALDTLAISHPNVGPFIGKQLIQRLVTSNPSPAYVARVTAAFEASGRNLGVMVKAILTDSEARDLSALNSTTFGKVREPVLRFSAFMRAVGVKSHSGGYLIDPTDDAATSLGQSALRAPSVFNFYRPGYVFPGGASASANLVAPELQIVNESSTAGYVNFMRDFISYGFGRKGINWTTALFDVQPLYLTDPNSSWWTLAKNVDAGPLVDQIDKKLFYSTMPAALRAEIKAAVESISFRNSASPAPHELNNRLWSALLLAAASPEFQVQK